MREKILKTQNTLNLQVDGLQHQETTLGSILVGKEQEFEATVGKGSPKLERLILVMTRQCFSSTQLP